jgi:hypothetical protein
MREFGRCRWNYEGRENLDENAQGCAKAVFHEESRRAMKATLQVINQMVADKVIGDYAIGGAIGAIAYLEPFLTQDVDVFMSFSTTAAGLIVSPAPIYEYLAARGYQPEREYVRIEGWLVQFLPTEKPLYAEALAKAVTRDVDGVPVRVFSAEHLMAIALDTGRLKDHMRIAQFIEAGVFDHEKLDAILRRHGLVDKWRRFEHRFLQP